MSDTTYEINDQEDCGECFGGEFDLHHICRKCGGTGKVRQVQNPVGYFLSSPDGVFNYQVSTTPGYPEAFPLYKKQPVQEHVIPSPVRSVLKTALEALEETTVNACDYEGAKKRHEKAIAALREALGAPHSAVHLSHCNMGEYVGSCKYCESDCPALQLATAQFGMEDMLERQRALELVQAFARNHDADWESVMAHVEAQQDCSQAIPSELTDYILQDDIHNRLTPRVVDIAYSAFLYGRVGKNQDDGGPCDWFNDTKPMVLEQLAKIKKDMAIDQHSRVGRLGCNPDNCSGCGGAPEAVDGFSNHTQQEPVDYLTCDIDQVRYMNIYSRPGTKVVFHGLGGYDCEKDRAKKSLVLGNTYTVFYTDVGSCSSSVRLQEVEGEFNTVMFGPAVQ